MITPLPFATPIKPACATLPLPGIMAEVIEKDGTPTPKGEKGYLCITKPWPSMIRTIWGDDERFVKSYFGDCKKNGERVYFSGDGAMVDENNYITITGRVDDVINVSGHRLGTAELEAAISEDEHIAEVAVIGTPHEVKGESIFVYAVLKDDANIENIHKHINQILARDIGNIAKADDIVAVAGLPKTRSGKIMRRILRTLAKDEEITQDISTLEDPTIVEKIKEALKKR